jgi:predicted DNA-binding transcriptional regulator AlpA
MVSGKYLDMAAVAEKLGLKYATVRGYNHLAKERRARDDVRPGDMPPPDETFGSSPVWLDSTIEKWWKNRPGRGVGGGRPRKDS